MSLNVGQSMGLDNMNLRFPWELADVVAGPLSIIFEKSWLSGTVPKTRKRETLLLFIRKGGREMQTGEPHLFAWEDQTVMDRTVLEDMVRHMKDEHVI